MRFGELHKQAKENGAIASLIPDGDFVLECTNANGKTNDAGVDSIGLLWKVKGELSPESGNINELEDDDPANGASGWQNLNFGEKAVNISMRQLHDLGLTDDFLDNAESVEEVAQACVGIVIDASVGHRNWGDGGKNVAQNVKVVEVLVGPVLPEVAEDAEVVSGDEEPF